MSETEENEKHETYWSATTILFSTAIPVNKIWGLLVVGDVGVTWGMSQFWEGVRGVNWLIG